MTRDDLAAKLGVSSRTISRYIREDVFPRYTTLHELSLIFGDDLEMLYDMVTSDKYPEEDLTERWSACAN